MSKIKNALVFTVVLVIFVLPTVVNAESTVNVNTAILDELTKITGVGPVTAQAIIDSRPYGSLDDLANAKGIGPKTLEKIKQQGIASVTGTLPPAVEDDHWLIPNKILKANVEYFTGEYDYKYRTDDKGRIVAVDIGKLSMTTRTARLPHSADTLDKLQGDHAGHLAGDRFGGSPKLDNLVSQASHVNLSSYKKLENKWADAVVKGQQVKLKVTLNYADNARPTSFDVDYTIDSTQAVETIQNVNP
ncbi:DNA/RNA non-specific endonuclease [Enterococcus caccae]|uniref:Competence protein ComEA helix-hairpin-helix repeat region n=1 Tax=Enterococcus caccae ATCC BAA-1240 TaxID=1158612 RepID=R3WEE7_9ENTE|nr:DNA/RNA non-specific endonuclease [Enterococcus caccae]EOL45832.1 competence protein ComEA helix-hairpin-helix repeat region [Enterococcus caccae ATCC BAA-1240]EOT61028.1 hypothetical protein I580_01930 [Enterococcus caccae ATCC BAA-1240]OJG27942.1 competence protein ComEA helix-hairpin-helix repeat region [Enterococcus caccae]